jgi:hypothetical protein
MLYWKKQKTIEKSVAYSASNTYLKQLNYFKPRFILSLGVITKNILKNIFKTTIPMGEICSNFFERTPQNKIRLYGGLCFATK